MSDTPTPGTKLSITPPTIAPMNSAGANTPPNKPKPTHMLVMPIFSTTRVSNKAMLNSPASDMLTVPKPCPNKWGNSGDNTNSTPASNTPAPTNKPRTMADSA